MELNPNRDGEKSTLFFPVYIRSRLCVAVEPFAPAFLLCIFKPSCRKITGSLSLAGKLTKFSVISFQRGIYAFTQSLNKLIL